VKIALLGVRGSTPAPGHDFAGFGGHTSCVAVFGDADERPRLVLDAGTGLQSLARLLGGHPFRGDLVLSHLHWDHVQGLPFSPSIDHPDARVALHVPALSPHVDVGALIGQAMSPPHFPIGPDGLLGHWRFVPMVSGPVAIESASMMVAPIQHKGGLTFGIRVEVDGVALAYLPDHALTDNSNLVAESAQALAAGVDLLLHDGQYLAEEVGVARSYGHATIEAAADFADRCEVGELMFTHYAPGRTDAQLELLAGAIKSTPGGIPVRFARQDQLIDVKS
jgi:ribonuclease BN (tRNA processing enzyme)